MKTPLNAGFGRTDITPDLGSLLMGYPGPDRAATGVRDGLEADALALSQGNASAVVISLTVCIVDDVEVEAIRRGVAERTGVAAQAITVGSTQTHSGPNTADFWGWCSKDTAYIGRMVEGAIEAGVEAIRTLRPATVGIGTASSQVGVNRRQIMEDHSVGLGVNPWGPYDPELTVVRFETDDGPLATLIHYGAHPTVLGSDNTLVSRAWPGVMTDRVEALTGAPAFFINGAVGDIAPRCGNRGAVGDGEAALMEVGYRGAEDALRAYHSVKELRPLELGVLSDGFELPYRPLADRAEAEAQFNAAATDKDQYGRGMCEYRHWQAVLQAHDTEAVSGRRYEQVLTRLGPLALVPFPGEPFVEIVLRLRDLGPFQYTLCASTSCGNNGYLVTRESLHRGGYEVWVTKAVGPYILAEHIDDALVQENLALLRRLVGG